jgi:hypothetical protein
MVVASSSHANVVPSANPFTARDGRSRNRPTLPPVLPMHNLVPVFQANYTTPNPPPAPLVPPSAPAPEVVRQLNFDNITNTAPDFSFGHDFVNNNGGLNGLNN